VRSQSRQTKPFSRCLLRSAQLYMLTYRGDGRRARNARARKGGVTPHTEGLCILHPQIYWLFRVKKLEPVWYSGNYARPSCFLTHHYATRLRPRLHRRSRHSITNRCSRARRLQTHLSREGLRRQSRSPRARPPPRDREGDMLAPISWAAMKAGTLPGAIPAKVSLRPRASVTAGLAKDVDAVNQ
jgi:hypothetical protein